MSTPTPASSGRTTSTGSSARSSASRARFVKGFYRRPWKDGDAVFPDGGGRVTELLARPLLAALYPELSLVRQPLAGEIAADRELLESLPFTTGYGVDIGLLIDAWCFCRLDSLAQVDLDVRQNRHRPLHELRPMALAVLGAVFTRVMREGRLQVSQAELRMLPLSSEGHSQVVERPPMASLPLVA
jgi:glucosyl-3-phosphoglycerate synthase